MSNLTEERKNYLYAKAFDLLERANKLLDDAYEKMLKTKRSRK